MQVIRCPYCVEGDLFKTMRDAKNERHVCDNCGHMVTPNDPDFVCICNKCRQLNPPSTH